jgi:alpha-tubulin suppressor-like RCC1 family protein
MCAIKTNGTLWCWSNNDQGQLGTGNTVAQYAGPNQTGTDTDWATVAAGQWHTCAVKTNGNAFCWGANWGQQMTGSARNILSPEPWGVGTQWTGVTAGAAHTCGLVAGNGIRCQGIYGYSDVRTISNQVTPAVLTTSGIGRTAGAI